MLKENSILINYIFPMALAFLIALIIQRLSHRLVGRFVKISDYAPEGLRLSHIRQRTLHDLIASSIGFLAFLVAGVFSLGLFVDTNTLIWMIGLFSAAFGLGARPLISDFLTGMSFIFEDTLDVGDKVEILEVQGVVEKLNLRTLFVRGEGGELFIIPNGEIRVIRNFSRGIYSTSKIAVRVPTAQLDKAIPFLEGLGENAVEALPNLLEPWEVIGTSKSIAEHTELTLLIKAKFGKAAELRPRLQKFIIERLHEADVTVIEPPIG